MDNVASASLIATAFALIMLIITAYFLVGVVLTTAEIVSIAQTDQINQQEERVRTAIEILNSSVSSAESIVYAEIENTGSVVISEIKYMDVYTINYTSNPPIYYTQGSVTGTWSEVSIEPDIINPGLWDPKEVMNISIKYPGDDPVWIQVTTPNGISDSTYI